MSKEAMELALAALGLVEGDIEWQERSMTRKVVLKTITALREALAEQPAQQAPKKAAELVDALIAKYSDKLFDSVGPHDAAKFEEDCNHIKQALAEQPAQLPFGVGGGLVAIKTLLSRDPCVHANTAIQMIDAILAEQPAQRKPLTDEEIESIRYITATLAAFGPDEAISMTKETWAKLRGAIKTLAEQPAQHPKAKAIAECLAVLRPSVKGKFPHEQALEELVGYIAAPQPAQQEPVAYFVNCTSCGEEKKVDRGNHHPWCFCGSDSFDWGNSRIADTTPQAQPAQQEPVGEVIGTNEYAGFGQIKHTKTIEWRGEPQPVGTKLYTSPPAQRTWVGLSDDDREAAMEGMYNRWDVAEAIETKLKERNT